MKVSCKSAIRTSTDASRPIARLAALLTLLSRAILSLITLFFALPSRALPDDFWKHKPPAQWSAQQAVKVVRRSPWAKLEVLMFLRKDAEAAFSVPTGTNHCDPDAIDQNGNCMQKGRIEAPVDSSRGPDAAPPLTPSAGMLVRWESATPVAQAFARLEELGERAVAAFQAPTPRLPPDRYVITVKLEQPGRTGFEPFAVPPEGKSALHATLKTGRGTVTPLETEFTGAGASSSVHFFFPRTLNGTPLLGPGRDSAEFSLQGAAFTVHSKFTLEAEFLQ